MALGAVGWVEVREAPGADAVEDVGVVACEMREQHIPSFECHVATNRAPSQPILPPQRSQDFFFLTPGRRCSGPRVRGGQVVEAECLFGSSLCCRAWVDKQARAGRTELHCRKHAALQRADPLTINVISCRAWASAVWGSLLAHDRGFLLGVPLAALFLTFQRFLGVAFPASTPFSCSVARFAPKHLAIDGAISRTLGLILFAVAQPRPACIA
jgi:hypothetical protein